MNARQDIVCRLCLKVSEYGFVPIDETARDMLDVLFVKMIFSVSEDPFMCEDCMQFAKKSLHFILECLSSEKIVLGLCTERCTSSVDLKHNSNQIIGGDTEICRFCIKKVERSRVASLDLIMKDTTFSEMLKTYMFQMDLNLVKNPVVCLQCRDNMNSYFKFLQICRDTEERIKTYKQSKGISNEKILLINVFKTCFECNKEAEICNSIMGVKKDFDMEKQVVIVNQNRETIDHMCDTRESSCIGDCVIMCDSSQFVMKDKSHNRLDSNTDRYQCDSCEFQTIYKHSLNRHLLTHKDSTDVHLYRCDSCKFKTKYSSSIRRHYLMHKYSSQIQMHQCESCKYRKKLSNNDSQDYSIYKNHSDVQTYQCDSCEYQAKCKGCLMHHLLVHRDSPKVKMFQCDSCEFSTKRKIYFENHMLTHKKSSEVYMYQCDRCEFQTKYKGSLDRHLREVCHGRK